MRIAVNRYPFRLVWQYDSREPGAWYLIVVGPDTDGTDRVVAVGALKTLLRNDCWFAQLFTATEGLTRIGTSGPRSVMADMLITAAMKMLADPAEFASVFADIRLRHVDTLENVNRVFTTVEV